jgi:glutaryl-CoA dehydrogenase
MSLSSIPNFVCGLRVISAPSAFLGLTPVIHSVVDGSRLTSPQPFVSVVSSFFLIIPSVSANRKETSMSLKFRGVDFIGFDALLTDDELLVRDTSRKFIEDNLIPIIEECNRAGRFPRELVKPMADLGFFGASLKGYGCAGMSNVEYGLVMQEMERGDSGVRSFVSVQSALVMYPIYAFGSDEQKQTWLPALQSGEKLGCFGLTEPDFGSNPGGMRTRARKVGKEYILNGEKMWITSGSIANVAVIWAKVEDEDNKIRGFLVETDRPGFKAEDIHGKWSLRASVTSGLSMQDVHIPESNLLPKTGGLKSPLMCLNQARYGIAWGALGAAMSCYDCALQYSILRKQFHDKPIASHQLVQEKLTWMINEITKAQLLVLQVGRLKDKDKAGAQHISMAKRNNVWMALECARKSRDILGANGVADEYPLMRHMMNLESVKTYEGTHDIHTLIIGQSVTGVDAF